MACCERAHSAGPAALEQIREWHPRFSDKSDEEIRQAPFTEEDARLVYAREHGFETWDDLTSRVNLLASNPATATTEPFMAAFAALQSGDAGRLQGFAAHESPPGRRARDKRQHAAESRRQFRRQAGLERRPVCHRGIADGRLRCERGQ